MYAGAFIANICLYHTPSILQLILLDGAKKTIKHQRELKQMTQYFFRCAISVFISVVVSAHLYTFFTASILFMTQSSCILFQVLCSFIFYFVIYIHVFIHTYTHDVSSMFYDCRILIDTVAILV